MSGPELSVNLGITEAQINNAIAVAVVETMTPERQAAMIRDVVRAHLQIRPSTYDKETLLSKTVGDYVRNKVVEVLKQSLGAMDSAISEIVRESLGKGFEESVLRQLRNALSRKVVSGINIDVSLEDKDD